MTAKKTSKKPFPFALLGKKVGMTQIFSADTGDVIPVTVVQVGPCIVLQKKTLSSDGYNAIQIGFDDKKKNRITKPEAGHVAKSKSAAKRFVKEVRLNEQTIEDYEVGQELRAELFKLGDDVDVTGISIGKGFAGVMKRHNFRGQKSSHNHEFFRHGGSIGNRSDPGKVFKNKKMPGQMGNEKITVQNLRVVGIESETNFVLLKGAVPGAKGGYVSVQASTVGKFEPRSAKASAPVEVTGETPTV